MRVYHFQLFREITQLRLPVKIGSIYATSCIILRLSVCAGADYATCRTRVAAALHKAIMIFSDVSYDLHTWKYFYLHQLKIFTSRGRKINLFALDGYFKAIDSH
jgi:hypothetical protein